MIRINNKYLIAGFIVIVILSLYFGSGALLGGGMNGKINESGWTGGNGLRWFPAIVAIFFGVLIIWLFFRKKKI
ncbi:MAG: LPXTG cell wall anchor domain-containing protein [Ignavibacteriales bacterium]|nr:LPXTG cell wall anchor domain-containing protein [Ignavibacteriales bacterium]